MNDKTPDERLGDLHKECKALIEIPTRDMTEEQRLEHFHKIELNLKERCRLIKKYSPCEQSLT